MKTKVKRTAEEKEALAMERRIAQIPKDRSYTVKLSTGKFHPVKVTYALDMISFTTKLSEKPVICAFGFSDAVVERKVRVYGKIVRNEVTNAPVVAKIKLPATHVILRCGSDKFTAKSVCKPPDKFDRRQGIKLALRRLLKNNELRKLFSEEDYNVLVKVCLTTPPKPGQIARSKHLAESKPKKEAAR